MPYERYIKSMLKSFGIKAPDDISKTVSWGKYMISRDGTRSDSIKVSDNQKEALFYDLLIEYVKAKKFLKDNYHDYEN